MQKSKEKIYTNTEVRRRVFRFYSVVYATIFQQALITDIHAPHKRDRRHLFIASLIKRHLFFLFIALQIN